MPGFDKSNQVFRLNERLWIEAPNFWAFIQGNWANKGVGFKSKMANNPALAGLKRKINPSIWVANPQQKSIGEGRACQGLLGIGRNQLQVPLCIGDEGGKEKQEGKKSGFHIQKG